MKNWCILFFLLGVVSLSQAQVKKVKIKDEKQKVRFYYSTDSVAINPPETKKMLRTFYFFYKAINTNNSEAYLSHLSPVSLEQIRADKLERKFKKFKGYAVNLTGKIQVRSIKKYEQKNSEPNPVYVCVLKLPAEQSIIKRVGFDPLKREKFDGVENHVGLHLTATEKGYKVVILW